MTAPAGAGGELRQDLLTGRWSAVAPGRADRPGAPASDHPPEDGASPAGSRDPACPFCPGNEAELPEILAESPGENGLWATRAVPNRYPAFGLRGDGAAATGGGADDAPGGWRLPSADVPPLEGPLTRTAIGYQEVVVESPDHDDDPALMSPEALRRVVRSWQERYRVARERAGGGRVFLFRNRGREAGRSLPHPHAQVVATADVPPLVAARERRAIDFHARSGRCLACALDDLEPDGPARTVVHTDDFTAVVPWAARTSCTLRVVPRAHRPDFGDAPPAEVDALADLLGVLLRALRRRAGDPPYNLMVHSHPDSAGPAALHWWLEILPRASQPAGFELASGVHIHPSSPAGDAALLRGER